MGDPPVAMKTRKMSLASLGREKQFHDMIAKVVQAAEGDGKAMGTPGKPLWICLPESRLVAWRDMLSFVALVLTFITVPFEVGFVETGSSVRVDELWVFNRCVDALFLADMVVQFFVATRKPNPILKEASKDDEVTDEVKHAMHQVVGEVYEYRLHRIGFEYLKGWLLLDAAALAPSFAEIYLAVQQPPDGSDAGANGADGGAGGADGLRSARSVQSAIRATRMIKLFRLIKLLKLLRAVKMINDPNGPFRRLVDWVTLAFIAHARKLQICKLLLLFLVLAHLQVRRPASGPPRLPSDFCPPPLKAFTHFVYRLPRTLSPASCIPLAVVHPRTLGSLRRRARPDLLGHARLLLSNGRRARCRLQSLRRRRRAHFRGAAG